MSEQQTGAQILCEALIREGVEVMFGIPGGAIMPFYYAMVGVPRQLRHVLCRHEQGAGHAAEGYARATGRVGVCLGTSGPGATNLVTAIADAWMDSTPIVAITGAGFERGAGQGCLPGDRYHRHHHADHQAQLPDQARRGYRLRGQGRVPHRLDRPARPGADRHHQGCACRAAWCRTGISS